MSSVQQQKRTVEQLRREAGIKRIPVSQAAEDLKVRTTAFSSSLMFLIVATLSLPQRFIHDHEQEDCLLVGFHSQKANPFREKSSCLLL